MRRHDKTIMWRTYDRHTAYDYVEDGVRGDALAQFVFDHELPERVVYSTLKKAAKLADVGAMDRFMGAADDEFDSKTVGAKAVTNAIADHFPKILNRAARRGNVWIIAAMWRDTSTSKRTSNWGCDLMPCKSLRVGVLCRACIEMMESGGRDRAASLRVVESLADIAVGWGVTEDELMFCSGYFARSGEEDMWRMFAAKAGRRPVEPEPVVPV